jgi:hypothetical protein
MTQYVIIHDVQARRYYSAKQLQNSAECLLSELGEDWDGRVGEAYNDEDCLCILQDVCYNNIEDVPPRDVKIALDWAKNRGILKKAQFKKDNIQDHYKIIEV